MRVCNFSLDYLFYASGRGLSEQNWLIYFSGSGII